MKSRSFGAASPNALAPDEAFRFSPFELSRELCSPRLVGDERAIRKALAPVFLALTTAPSDGRPVVAEARANATIFITELVEQNAPGILSRVLSFLSITEERYWPDLSFCRAAELGRAQCLRLLIPFGNPALLDQHGRNAMFCAASAGRAQCVKALLPRFSQMPAGSTGWSPLAIAAFRGHSECFGLLLPHSDPNARNADGRTPLMQLAIASSTRGVETMLAHCDPNLTDPNGDTALSFAIHFGSLVCTRMILRCIDPALVDSGPKNPFLKATDRNDDEIISLLLPFSNPNQQDDKGCTPLMNAIAGRRPKAAAALCFRTDLSLRDHKGRTALDIALDQDSWPALRAISPALSFDQLRDAAKRAPSQDWISELVARREASELSSTVSGDRLDRLPSTPDTASPPSRRSARRF